MSHGKNFIAVLNNWTEEELSYIQAAAEVKCNYYIIAREIGESGTPHLQMYFQFLKDTRLSTLKNMNSRVHWESARGTVDDQLKYIRDTTKGGKIDEEPIIWGEPTIQGARNDLSIIARDVISGVSLSEIATNNPVYYIRYNRGLNALANIINKPIMRDNLQVCWLWGAAGAGKTRYVFDNFHKVYIKDGTQWWDGYTDDVDCICIDDFDGRWPYRDLLRLLDRYPYRGQVKGGYVNINCPVIYITADRTPEMLFLSFTKHELDQLKRRIHTVREVVRDVVGNTADNICSDLNPVLLNITM